MIFDNVGSMIERDGKLMLAFIFLLSSLPWSFALVGLVLCLITFYVAPICMSSLVAFLLVS